MLYLATILVLIVYLVLVWLLGGWLHLHGSDIWILRGVLAFLGLVAGGVAFWYAYKVKKAKEASGEGDSPAGATDEGAFAEPSTDGQPAAPAGTLRFWNQDHWQEEFERWCAAREVAPDVSAAIKGIAPSSESSSNDRAADGPSAQGASENERRLVAADRQLAARAAELEARYRELKEEREALESERDALESEREAFVAERQAERHRLADQRRVMSENLMRQRARLRRRRDDFDVREMALRQLRADLLRMQQQTLEMRLGAEEQWARMRGKGPSGDARREGAA